MKLIISLNLFILLSLFSCVKSHNLQSFISQNLKGDSGVIYLKNYNSVEWDKLYIVLPYSSLKNTDQDFSRIADGVSETGIQMRDDVSIVLFFNKGLCVEQDIVKNNPYLPFLDPSSKNGVLCFKRDKAMFKYYEKDHFYYAKKM